jgi:hypothetical protein
MFGREAALAKVTNCRSGFAAAVASIPGYSYAPAATIS